MTCGSWVLYDYIYYLLCSVLRRAYGLTLRNKNTFIVQFEQRIKKYCWKIESESLEWKKVINFRETSGAFLGMKKIKIQAFASILLGKISNFPSWRLNFPNFWYLKICHLTLLTTQNFKIKANIVFFCVKNTWKSFHILVFQ